MLQSQGLPRRHQPFRIEIAPTSHQIRKTIIRPWISSTSDPTTSSRRRSVGFHFIFQLPERVEYHLVSERVGCLMPGTDQNKTCSCHETLKPTQYIPQDSLLRRKEHTRPRGTTQIAGDIILGERRTGRKSRRARARRRYRLYPSVARPW